jgi:hypothetical protein
MNAHDLQDMFTNFDNVQVHFLNKVKQAQAICCIISGIKKRYEDIGCLDGTKMYSEVIGIHLDMKLNIS